MNSVVIITNLGHFDITMSYLSTKTIVKYKPTLRTCATVIYNNYLEHSLNNARAKFPFFLYCPNF